MAVLFWISSAVALLTFLLILLVLRHVLHLQYRIYKYRHLPSPKLLPHWSSYFVGHGNLFQKLRTGEAQLMDLTLQWKSELGPVFVVHLPSYSPVICITKEAVKEFVASGRHFKRAESYAGLGYLLSERFLGRGLVVEHEDSLWEPRRRLFNPAFHRNYLRLSMEQFNQSTDKFIKRLTLRADGKTEVKMLEELTRLTLDIICKVGFDFDCKSLTGDRCIFYDSLSCALRGLTRYDRNPWKTYSIHPETIAERKKAKECVRFIREVGRDIISKRIESLKRGEETKNDILSYILKATQKDGQLQMEELLDEFATFFLAGNETTASSISSMLMCLSQNPGVMLRLQEEVKEVLGKKTCVEFDDLPKFEYMTAVFKETLRLTPPVAGTVRVASYDVEVNGHNIPKGAAIFVMLAIHRLPEYFPDPLEFRPERFLNDSVEPYTYTPFAVGPRSCIGQQFAMMEMKVILSRLLQTFHLEWVPGQSYFIIEETTSKPKDGALHFLTLKSQMDS